MKLNFKHLWEKEAKLYINQMVAEAAEFKMSREKRRGGKKDKVKEWYGEEKKGA